MLAPRYVVFTSVEGAIIDRDGSPLAAEEALAELNRQHIPWVLLTSRTRAELDPIRRKLEHAHPFVTETGGGLFIPDGYFNVRIPDAVRTGRSLCVPLGRPVQDVRAALDDISEECAVGVAGFHHLTPREIADNLGVSAREAELATKREFDEPFFFTSADQAGIDRFVTRAKELGFEAREGHPFWHLSSGNGSARAARILMDLFHQASHSKRRAIGVGASAEDLPWLRAMNHAALLPADSSTPEIDAAQLGRISMADAAGPAGWSSTMLRLIA